VGDREAVTLQSYEVSWRDFRPARLLTGRARSALAARTGVCAAALERLELGDGVQRRTRERVFATLLDLGVVFHARENVCHRDGRIALTGRAVGRLHGHRLARARRLLGLSVDEVAQLSDLHPAAVERLELLSDLQDRPSLRIYALVGTLQRQGYVFRIGSRGGRRGDYLPAETASAAPSQMQRYETSEGDGVG